MTLFWVDDFSELYKNNNYLNIIPNSNMSYIELLNAMSRFLILVIIIILIFFKLSYAILPLIFLLYVIIYYYSKENHFKTFYKSFDKDFRKKHKVQIVDNYYNNTPIIDIKSNISNNSNISDVPNSLNSLNSLKSLNSLNLETISCNTNDSNNSEYAKLFKDNSVLFTENNTNRNSSKNITHDLGNTSEFANNLYNPVPTCKEKTLNCYNYENLKHKR